MALIRRNMFFIKKTASYYVVHITVAALVAYAVTGDLVAAITLSLLEPTIQAVVFFFHEKVWQGPSRTVSPKEMCSTVTV